MKNKQLLSLSVIFLLVFMGNSFAETMLTPQEIKAVNRVSNNTAVVAESILPKTNDYSGEDELPIPEGVRPIQGMNVPLKMKEVKIYGLDHKPYGVAFLDKVIANAVEYHNTLENAPLLKGSYKVQRKDQMYSILVNEDVYLAFVYAVAQEITNKYQSDQFLLARAIVPEQTIDQAAGSIEICVAEGYLSSDPTIVPSIMRNPERFKRMLKPHFSGLTNLKPLDFKVLERTLLLARDMSGLDIKTTFKQAEKQSQENTDPADSICQRALNNGAGATALEVRVDLDKFTGEISVDNYGTNALGPELVRFTAGVNSLIKAGDTYQLNVGNAIDTDESLSFAFNANYPIGTRGLKGKLFYSHGDAEPGGFPIGSVINNTEVLGLALEYSYIRSRKKNLTYEIGLRNHSVVTNSVVGDLENTSLDTLRLKSTLDFSDKYNGVNLISIGLVAGINGNSVAQAGLERDLDENFILLEGELARYQALSLPTKTSGNLTWINSLSWQYANDPLFASEEFSLGGRDYGRGYDLAIISGDNAIALKTELQYVNKNKYGKYKVYSFLDFGVTKNIDVISIGDESFKEESQYLVSVGIGAEIEKNNWFAKLEATNPVKIDVADASGDDEEIDPQLYFHLGYRW